MTLADLQLSIGTGALLVHFVLSQGFPDRSLALSWGECPQKSQHSVGVSLRSCRRSGPLFCAESRISLRDGDSGKSPALPGPTPSLGGPALRRAFYLVPSPQRVCGFVNCWLQEFPCGGSHPYRELLQREGFRVAMRRVLCSLRDASGSAGPPPLFTSP